MATYRDLGFCGYFGEKWSETLMAVGWVESREQFAPAPVDPRFFDALTELLVNPWQPLALAGRHHCTLCRFTGGPSELRYREKTVALGATNLFVFDERRAYVAPSLIAHYVDSHDYAPPEEFQRAVLSSPPMRSMEYLKLLRHHGIDGLAKGGPS